MIFWRIFYIFSKIGIFNFGGGYAMIALIQHEVVEKNGWLTAAEFTDVVAISQMTPGPIGINVATYTGYTAVVNAGYDAWLGVVGALLASFSVILLPVLAMLLVCRFLLKHRENRYVSDILSALRVVIVGVIAAAALLLVTPGNFGEPALSRHFVASVAIFAAVFFSSYKYKANPIVLMVASGILGWLLYGGVI